MNYRNKEGAAELGIKICDFTRQEKGYGTELLTVFIDALFRYYGYEKMIFGYEPEKRAGAACL